MGANSTQALGVVLFFVAGAFLAGAWAAGGNFVLILVGVVGLAFSISLLVKAKPWEKMEK